ncbi:MAG: serine protease [Clostridia bacterium]|nr:serine protease [Clostridia bacterium]
MSNTYKSNSSSRTEQKNERIRKKSERISAKGKKISERNAHTYQFFAEPQVEVEPTDHTVEDTSAVKTVRVIKARSNNGFGAAAILSAISILLLIAMTSALMLGLFPSPEKSIVFIPTSTNNDVIDGDASPDTISKAMSSVVVVSAELASGTSTGSGFIVGVSEDKSYDYVATNYHVVADASEIYVRLYETGDYVLASLVGYSFEDDIAVLKIASSGLSPLTLANYATCRAGDKVYAMGTPEGENFSWTVTQGIISAVDRILWIYDDNENLEKTMRVLQTDTPVNPGNSGGPLINARGEVVGIVSMKLGESEGVGFALPIDGAIEIIWAIIATGSADGIESSISNERAFLGITCVGVKEGHWYKISSDKITESDAINGSFRAKASGVYVLSVSVGSAVYGKLEKGDIITAINGSKIYNLAQLSNILYDFKIGDEITLTYHRGGQYHSVSVTLGGQS